jgi:RNA polymerase sigma factor (sigma-70 family)
LIGLISVPDKSDAALIAAARCSDKAAFGELIERHLDRARRVAMQLVADHDVAWELTQDAILQAYLSLAHLRQPEHFGAWLRGIVRNLCRSYLRSRRPAALALDDLLDHEQAEWLARTDILLDPYQVVETQEVQGQVQAALTSLSPGNRAVTQLFYLEEQSINQIAQQLAVSPNAVKGRLYQSRQHLKTQLAALAPKQRRRGTMIKITKLHAIANAMTESFIIYLLDLTDQRFLPIWVGPHEGWQIAAYLRSETFPRPLTLQLFANTLDSIGAKVEEVRIETLKETTYYAVLKVRNGKHTYELDARPSDAIGLALHLGSPLWVTDEIMAQSGQPLPQPFEEMQWVAAEQQRLNDLPTLSRELQQKVENDPTFVTAEAKAVLLRAATLAQALHHNYIGTEHLLLSLVAEPEQPVAQLLQRFGVDQARLTAEFDRLIGRGATPLAEEPLLVPRLAQVIALAHLDALRTGQTPTNPIHLLIGLINEGKGMAIRLLRALGADPDEVRAQALARNAGG